MVSPGVCRVHRDHQCSSTCNPRHTRVQTKQYQVTLFIKYGQQMNQNKSLAFLIISLVLVIDGERWYSATLIENRSLLSPELIKRFQINYIQDAEHRYMPLSTDSTVGQRTVSNEWQGMKRTNAINKTTSLFDSHDNQKSHETSANRNIYSGTNSSNPSLDSANERPLRTYNTVNNIKVHKITQLKRKFIRKRCPAFRPRQKKQLATNGMKTRFLEIFQVVEFDHVPCTSSSGLEGTCLHESDCQTTGGATMGTCADGYGTCCVKQFSCDDTSAAPAGWFTNPGFPDPSSDRLSCAVAINKISEEIKQLRLDFLHFELLPPTAGTCEQDRFVVSGQNVNSIFPILCGVNTGLHAYIEVGDVDGPINLSIQTASSEKRLFAIEVTQLSGADDLVAPSGCLQYFKDIHGYLESFNYRDASDTSIAKTPSYLNNLNYAMCIERAPASCSITYTNAGVMQIVNYDSDGLPVIPPDQAGVEIFNCPSDWLLMSAARLCGERLNDGSVLQDFALDAPITDNGAGPIVVWFKSDEGYVGRGFKLKYQQNSCT